MLTGIKFLTRPKPHQKLILSQWMGCARVVWNAKVDEEKYHRTFARKYYPIGTFSPIDQTLAQFKSEELTPWLSACPFSIMKNSVHNWFETYRKFMKGQCRRPKRKPKTDQGSVLLTRDMFRFERCAYGKMRLFVGLKRKNIGYLSFKATAPFSTPNMLYIRRERGRYYVSFCYEDGQSTERLSDNSEHLAVLQFATKEYLEENTLGVNRGTAIPVHAGSMTFDFSEQQKKHATRADRYIQRLQRRMLCQKKGSNRRRKTRYRLATHHAKKASIREDFAHKTSRSLVDSQAKAIVFEDLRASQQTQNSKPTEDGQGGLLPNKARKKAGLYWAEISLERLF